MKAIEASATQAEDHTPARRSFSDRLRQHALRLLRRTGGSRPVRPIEVAAGASGIIAVFTALDTAQASFAAAWWLLVLIVMRNDLADFLIPDEASLAIALLGLAQVAAMAPINGQPAEEPLSALAVALFGGVTAAAVLWAIGRAFRCVRGHDGLGFGDVKLIGASGIWLSPFQQAVALELAALAALAVILIERRNSARDCGGILPFGAFLAPAAWLAHVIHTLSPDLFERWL